MSNVDYRQLQRDIENECLDQIEAYIREQQGRYRHGSGIKHQVRYSRAWFAVYFAMRDLRRVLEIAERDNNEYPVIN